MGLGLSFSSEQSIGYYNDFPSHLSAMNLFRVPQQRDHGKNVTSNVVLGRKLDPKSVLGKRYTQICSWEESYTGCSVLPMIQIPCYSYRRTLLHSPVSSGGPAEHASASEVLGGRRDRTAETQVILQDLGRRFKSADCTRNTFE